MRTRGGEAEKSAVASGSDFNGVTYATLFRHIGYLLAVVAVAVVGFLYWEELFAFAGYSFLAIGVWAAMFVYLLFTRTRWFAGRYREVLSSVFIVLGISGSLGVFDAPIGAPVGATMGGGLGEFVAREPFEWDRYDLILWHQVLAWARVGVLIAIGAYLQFTKYFHAAFSALWIGFALTVAGSIGLATMVGGAASGVSSKIAARRSARAESSVGDAIIGEDAASADTSRYTAVAEATSYADSTNTDQTLLSLDPLSEFSLIDGRGDQIVGVGNTVYTEDEDASESVISEEIDIDDIVSTGHRMTTEEEFARAMGLDVPIDLNDAPTAEREFQINIGGSTVETQPNEVAPDGETLATTGAIERVDGGVSPTTKDVIEEIKSGATIATALQDFPWHLPPVEFLSEAPEGGVAAGEIDATSDLIEDTLEQHGVAVTVDQVRVGPTVTMYGLKPGWKGGGTQSKSSGQRVRVDTILNREKDIALALSSPNIRFESVVPGASVVGIEVPNARPTPVNVRSVMDSDAWAEFVDDAALPVPLGMGSGGDPMMADLAKMPHTLVAGATGSGKSVCMNTIVTGLLMSKTPMEVRMVMIDPKRVELTPYQGIPHLYAPVIVDPETAVKALKSLVKEMMDRFEMLEKAGVKNIVSFNERNVVKMPYLVLLVDELADLMLTSSNEVEQLLVRLAQLGRATGVHLVVATQRPSVDVVTGLIKANFPSRISFAVGSQVDSRTILDAVGADKLLGKGDMLYKPIDLSQPVRVQGAFLAEDEIESVIDFWLERGAPPLPQLDIDGGAADGSSDIGSPSGAGDTLFAQACDMAQSQKTLSTSLLQRRLRIGYPRAARLMDELEDAGVVGPGEPGKPRKVMQKA